jgi:membrane-bound lytic murein transglycosylase B
MEGINRRRHTAAPHVARRAGALALAACLLVSCNTQRDPAGAPESDHAAASAGAAGGRSPAGLPTVPARDAATLARQLDEVMATLRDPDARPADVRRAGQLQQLAVGRLAAASGAFRRQVMARLDRRTALVVGGDLRAARLLDAMTAPQKKLPPWHIVAPPPPAKLRGYYRQAQRRTGVPWTYLAAIHLVETRMGRIRGVSTAGARGPMQFLPSTWSRYGAGGDINDPHDAILAAARLLKANGAPAHMAKALWHYNPSDRYVGAVGAYARTMRRSSSTYRGYWHWRVLYRQTRGTYLLPIGYPDRPAVLLAGR